MNQEISEVKRHLQTVQTRLDVQEARMRRLEAQRDLMVRLAEQQAQENEHKQ